MLIVSAIINKLQAALFGVVASFVAPEVEVAELDAFAESEDADTQDDARARRQCTAASASSPTGRQWATVWNSPRNPSICLRQRLGGTAPRGYPDCFRMARSIGCGQVLSVD